MKRNWLLMIASGWRQTLSFCLRLFGMPAGCHKEPTNQAKSWDSLWSLPMGGLHICWSSGWTCLSPVPHGNKSNFQPDAYPVTGALCLGPATCNCPTESRSGQWTGSLPPSHCQQFSMNAAWRRQRPSKRFCEHVLHASSWNVTGDGRQPGSGVCMPVQPVLAQ